MMKDGLYVLTAAGCPHCETFREKYKAQLDKIKEIVVGDLKEEDETWSVIDKLNIIGTPTVFKKEGDSVCEMDSDDWDSEVSCVDLKEQPGIEQHILGLAGGRFY